MRRTVFLATLAALVAGLVVAAVGLAGDRPSERPASARAATPAAGPFAMASDEARARSMGSAPAGTHGAGLHARLVGDLADRLDVPEARLRAALRDVKQRARARGGLSLRGASPAQRAKLKQRLAGDLAGALGVAPDRVIAAVRAEIEQALGIAVTFGAITKQGRDLALGCYDDPASCDIAALKREAVSRRRGR